jgi:hypothetical protein
MREVLLSQSEIFRIEKERLSNLVKDDKVDKEIRVLLKDCLAL